MATADSAEADPDVGQACGCGRRFTALAVMVAAAMTIRDPSNPAERCSGWA
jgi:hypothetical protein